VERRDHPSTGFRGGQEASGWENAPADRGETPARATDQGRPSSRQSRHGWDYALPSYGPNAGARVVTVPVGRSAGRRPAIVGSRRGVILLTVGALLLLTIVGSVDAILRYNQVRSLAADGVRHLRVVQGLIQSKGGVGGLLDATTLQTADAELKAAQSDFHELRAQLDSPTGTLFLASHTPVLGGTLGSAATLAAAADEACSGGLSAVHGLELAMPVIKGGLFAADGASGTSSGPTLDAALLNAITADLDGGLAHLLLAGQYASTADVGALPSAFLKPSEAAQLRALRASWPALSTQLTAARQWLAVAPRLLGITAPYKLLVVLEDRSELRATGGFMGNYGVITLQGGKVQPFALTDTYLLDRPYADAHGGFTVPTAFSWWPFHPFALRDSNLSADFPTSARLIKQLFQAESGTSVDGVMAVTPAAIQRVLRVVGNINVAQYGEVVTPDNLEALIHKHQLAVFIPGQERKTFTAVLGQELLKKLRALSTAQLVTLITQSQPDLATKDAQLYLGDGPAQSLLAKVGLDNTIRSGAGDSLMVVDSNIGVNKANQFVTATYTDHVSIDAAGTATHSLQIAYRFHATDLTQLYGADWYKTYVRVYVPAGATPGSATGFTTAASPGNQFAASDQPGAAMWAGSVIVPDGSPRTLTLTWSVPHAAARDSTGRTSYLMTYQRQAGSTQILDATVSALNATQAVAHFQGALDMDKRISATY
jgi:hypothetical protein